MAASEVDVVYAVYGDEHRDSGLRILEKFLDELFPRLPRRVVVVNNQMPTETEVGVSERVHRIGGDNSSQEFSAYDRGVWWLRSYYGMGVDSVVVISNDTFHRSYGRDYLELFDTRVVQGALANGCLLGYVDRYPRPVELFGLKVQSWVRTSLFLARWRQLEALLPLTLPVEDGAIFSGDWRTFFRMPSPLSENYRSYLKTWLFGEPDPAGEFDERWHSYAQLTPENLNAFQKKARSIFCEHYLSARAFRLGIPIYDVRTAGTVEAVESTRYPIANRPQLL